MRRRDTILALLLCLCAASCAPKPAPVSPKALPVADSRLLTPAETVLAFLDCANKPLPYLALEENKLTPNPARPGDQRLHRIVYDFAPPRAARPRRAC